MQMIVYETYSSEIRLCNNARSCVHAELHFANLLIHLLHKSGNSLSVSTRMTRAHKNALDDEVDDLVLQHRFGVRVGNKE